MSNTTMRQHLRAIHDTDTRRTAILRALANRGRGLYQTAQLVTGTGAATGDTLDIGGVGYVLQTVNTAFTPTLTVVTTATLGTFSAAHGLSVDDVIRSSTEYMRVAVVLTSTTVTLERGFAGSTAAAGGYSGATVVTAGGVGALNSKTIVGGRYIIPTAGTYTNTVIRPLIVAAVNYWEPKIGTGLTAVDSASGGTVDFIRPYSGAGLVRVGTASATADSVYAVLADGSTTTMTTTDSAAAARGVSLNRGDVIKVESEYIKIVSRDNAAGTSWTVARAYNGSTGAAHTGSNDPIDLVQQPNVYSKAGTSSGSMSTEWSGGVDDLQVSKSEYVVAYPGATSFTLWLPAAAKGAKAILMDDSAKATQICVEGAAGPSCAVSASGRKLVVTEGTTAFATSDNIVVSVWY